MKFLDCIFHLELFTKIIYRTNNNYHSLVSFSFTAATSLISPLYSQPLCLLPLHSNNNLAQTLHHESIIMVSAATGESVLVGFCASEGRDIK